MLAAGLQAATLRIYYRAKTTREQRAMATKFEDYSKKYKNVNLERRNGILQVTLHTNGKDLIWGAEPHDELSFLFGEIARDPDNRVVILTGTGDTFAAN